MFLVAADKLVTAGQSQLFQSNFDRDIANSIYSPPVSGYTCTPDTGVCEFLCMHVMLNSILLYSRV